MPQKNRSPWIKIAGEKISVNELLTSGNYFQPGSAEYEVVDFILKWVNKEKDFTQKSSGSTGMPKTISIKRSQMQASAEATIKTLRLNENDTALLNISPNFIGGKMMVVRALVGNMNLIVGKLSGNPLEYFSNDDKVDFFSFVPYQLSKILSETPELKIELNKAKAIILGGAAVSKELEKQILDNISVPVFSTYGMSETVSHVALKRINGSGDAKFDALENISFSQDSRGCLIIHAEQITGESSLITNDVVKLYGPSHFEWLGRYDFVINSGGIKIHPEQLEEQICQLLHNKSLLQPFFLFSEAHEQLGSCVCMILEGTFDEEEIFKILKSELPPYHLPKKLYMVRKFKMTKSGKIDRLSTLKQAKIHYN